MIRFRQTGVKVDSADLAVLWSKLADLGNLAIVVDLADWKQIFFEGMMFRVVIL